MNQIVRKLFCMIMLIMPFVFACGAQIDSELENQLKAKLDGASKQERYTELAYRYRMYESQMRSYAGSMIRLKNDIKSLEDAIKISKAMGGDGSEIKSTLDAYNASLVENKKFFDQSKAKLDTVIKLAIKYDVPVDILGK